jgi:enterochelin esterase-like enzyme
MKIHLILLPFLLIQFLTGTFLPPNPQDTREMSVDISQQSTCIEKSGKVETRTIQSVALKRALDYRVYTPPCYNSSVADPYPVLYLLHGSSANADQWIQLGLQTKMDELLAEGKIIPFLVVLPHEAAYLEDTRTSKYGQAILEELIPAVQKNFHVATDPAHTAIGGLSRGAGWAIHLGLSHPDVFGAVGAHSLALFYADINQIEKWRKLTAGDSLPRVFLDIGLQDSLKDSAKKFELKLSEYSYPHEWHLNSGTHNAEYWIENISEYLRWYSQGWEE